MRKKIIAMLVSALCLTTVLTGCGSKGGLKSQQSSNESCVINVEGNAGTSVEPLVWVELDQLTTHSKMRRNWDDALGIIKFDVGSKNGVIYSDLEGNWTGNNTLYNAFRNKTFVEDYWDNASKRSELAGYAQEEFSDLNNEDRGIIGGLNAYFNLIYSCDDGSSGLGWNATRAEAMGIIARADTPVSDLSVDEAFENAVGSGNTWNVYSQLCAEDSWLNYEDGSLNSDNYNGFITKAELAYMIIHRYMPIEFDLSSKTLADKQGFTSLNKKTGQREYGYAWEAYVLEYSIENQKDGLTTELQQSLDKAAQLGIITGSDEWYKPVTRYDVINALVKTYKVLANNTGFDVAVRNGANTGEVLFESADLESLQEEIDRLNEEQLISAVSEEEELPDVDITDTDTMLEVYGDEFDLTDEEYEEAKSALEGFTIEECDKYMVVNSNVNVRVGPSTEFRVVSSLAYKNVMHVTGRCAETGWYRIATKEGKIAYVCGAYMTDISDDSSSESTGTTSKVSAEEAQELRGDYEGKKAGEVSDSEDSSESGDSELDITDSESIDSESLDDLGEQTTESAEETD